MRGVLVVVVVAAAHSYGSGVARGVGRAGRRGQVPTAAPGEPVPEGWFLYDCECGVMCYTFIRPAFDVWYFNKHNPDLPPKDLGDELEKAWGLRPGG